jgi:hypothetical protein
VLSNLPDDDSLYVYKPVDFYVGSRYPEQANLERGYYELRRPEQEHRGYRSGYQPGAQSSVPRTGLN